MMKRNLYIGMIALLIIGVFGLTACGKQEPKATQPEALTTIPVFIDGDIMTLSNGVDKATITRQSTGYVANYGDFHVEYKNPEYINGQVVAIGFREWTSDDLLDVRVEPLGYRHQRETYTRNGVELVLDIDDHLTDVQHQRLIDFLADGPSNSVMANADGYVLASILEPNWDNIDVAINSLSPDKRPQWGDVLCDAATACMAAKCWAGGIANSVCGTCMGIRFACAVMDIFGLWVD